MSVWRRAWTVVTAVAVAVAACALVAVLAVSAWGYVTGLGDCDERPYAKSCGGQPFQQQINEANDAQEAHDALVDRATRAYEAACSDIAPAADCTAPEGLEEIVP